MDGISDNQIKGDTAKNVSEGTIQVVDLCPSWDLRTSASWAAGMAVNKMVAKVGRRWSMLVAQAQPYLFATIFKHFLYVWFELLVFIVQIKLKVHWEIPMNNQKKPNISTKI